ncbi:Protein arginine N-methyltransferase 3 [Modicella reniformis]|uniref:type I protein arginine methyltransferase n=1 Tax=Modicella reniformis TaxID=1440133 RepID=A0A9P6IZF0_9FUNG|nr:Protein arginine N-methyltransferase 3 [Modicella reniformis]
MSSRILQPGSTSNDGDAVFSARRQSIASQVYTQSEYSDSEIGEQDNRWDDWEAEDGMGAEDTKCLFCVEIFPSAREVFAHCTASHGFNFLQTRQRFNLDFYQSIRLINYLRKQALVVNGFDQISTWTLEGNESFLNDDEFLRPVLEDDSLLYAFEELEVEEDFSANDQDHHPPLDTTILMPQGDARKMGRSPYEDIETTTELEAKLLKQLRLVEERLFATKVQLQNTEMQFQEYRARVKESFFDTLEDATARSIVSQTRQENGDEDRDPTAVMVAGDEGNYYFNSYAHSDIHQQMLNDRVRTEGYRDYIYENKDIFKGKTVLDVGCGTGILSMFAARAGAAKVLSVDNSDIIDKARKNIEENGFQEVITLYRGKIEEIKLPCKVDIIISEWMGYFLLYEAMLDSVLIARDRFLAPGGILAPSQTRILFTASSDESFLNDHYHYWNDVYGFKMSTMKEGVLQEAVVDFVSPETIVTNTVTIKDLPHQTITVVDLDFISDFELEMQRDDQICAFVGYFDTWFSRDGKVVPLDVGITKDELKRHDLNGFTTGPVITTAEETHWKQTMFVLQSPIELKKGDKIKGTFFCIKNINNPRALDLRIKYEIQRLDSVAEDHRHCRPEDKAELAFYLR